MIAKKQNPRRIYSTQEKGRHPENGGRKGRRRKPTKKWRVQRKDVFKIHANDSIRREGDRKGRDEQKSNGAGHNKPVMSHYTNIQGGKRGERGIRWKIT